MTKVLIAPLKTRSRQQAHFREQGVTLLLVWRYGTNHESWRRQPHLGPEFDTTMVPWAMVREAPTRECPKEAATSTNSREHDGLARDPSQKEKGDAESFDQRQGILPEPRNSGVVC